MRIHVFVDEFPPFLRGGLGTYAMEMTKKLARKNNVCVFTRGNDKIPRFEWWHGAGVIRAPNISPDCYPSFLPPHVRMWDRNGQRFYAETLFYNLLSASLSIQLGKTERPDVIAAHDWLSFPAGIISSGNVGAPLVAHFHSTEYGRIATPSPAVCEIEKEGVNRAKTVITVSYAMKEEIEKYYQAKNVEVVYNGVDVDKYSPDRFDREKVENFRRRFAREDEKIVLFLGRLTWVKGIDSLIRAMPEIERECGNVRLIVVGKGELEEEVSRLVRDLKLNACLRFEYVSEEERILHYLSSDVVVIPSRYEPFGIVCTEAMALEKPVVVGAKGTSGLREQVISGETGYHINPDDPHDIAVYTSILLNDDELRKKMGKKARKRVLENFTWDVCVEKTEEVYMRSIL